MEAHAGLAARAAAQPQLRRPGLARPLLRDVRFRRALSLAIDRREINKAVFFGLGQGKRRHGAAGEPALPAGISPKAWIAHDPDQANALLDEIGPRQARRRRHPAAARRPPGEIIVETAGESTLETDVLELDHRSLAQDRHRAVHPHLAARRVPQPRARRPDHDVDVVGHRQRRADRRHEPGRSWRRPATTSCNGRTGACTTCRTARRARRPTCPRRPSWSSCSSTGASSASSRERAAIWHEMLALYTDQVFSIGIVNGTLQPVVASAQAAATCPRRRSTASTRPAYFGVYMPDTFWFDEEA